MVPLFDLQVMGRTYVLPKKEILRKLSECGAYPKSLYEGIATRLASLENPNGWMIAICFVQAINTEAPGWLPVFGQAMTNRVKIWVTCLYGNTDLAREASAWAASMMEMPVRQIQVPGLRRH